MFLKGKKICVNLTIIKNVIETLFLIDIPLTYL